MKTCTRLLGSWWIDVAIRGAVEYLPLVNQNAVVVSVDKQAHTKPWEWNPEQKQQQKQKQNQQQEQYGKQQEKKEKSPVKAKT